MLSDIQIIFLIEILPKFYYSFKLGEWEDENNLFLKL
jgi:hypothetical protein